MRLIDVLRPECVVAGAALANKDEALRQIARTAKKSPHLEGVSEQEILDALREREALGSTGFGGGIAIPHCRLESVTEFVVGLMTPQTDIAFRALDEKPVGIFVFIIAPAGQSNRHIRLLSAISQVLLTPGVTKELRGGATSEALLESFLRHTRADIDTTEQAPRRVFSIFIQDEGTFRDVLEKLTGLEASSLVVLSTESASAYLMKMPLLAGFWRDKASNFGMLILAVADKGLTNEIIRRIESVTGTLSEQEGVMVLVQDVAYWAGSL